MTLCSFTLLPFFSRPPREAKGGRGFKLKRAFIFLFMSFSFFSVPSLAINKTSHKTCAELLSNNSGAEDFQSQVRDFEKEVQRLTVELTNSLVPFQDPFAMAFSVDEGHRVFERLSRRRYQGKWIQSPMARINSALREYHNGQTAFQSDLVNWVIEDSRFLLRDQSSNYEQADYQSNLLALHYLEDYLRRFKEPERVVDRDGQTDAEAEQEEQSSQKQDSQQQEDFPPEYPELPDAYKPQTNDTQEGSGGSQTQHRIAEVNFKTPFFAQRYFSEIVRGAAHVFREVNLPMTHTIPSRTRDTGRELVVRTFGKRQVDLFLPPLFKPLQPTDPRAEISRSGSGGYVLKMRENLNEIHIPLVEDSGQNLMPHIEQIYTRPVGFDKAEWPDKIQMEILRKFPEEENIRRSNSSPLQIAQAIADHIATAYLYSVGERPETDPIEALQAGAFQCDMAAYIMVGLLRDVYSIPSRVVGGFRAKKFQNGKDGKSYLVVPGEAHAWVEVFYSGRWHLFDPTPVKKDKKDSNEDGEKDEYSDNSLENTPKAEQGQDSDGEPSGSASGEDAAQSDKDHSERLEEDTRARTEGLERSRNEEQEQRRSRGGEESTDFDREELADQLELGSLELEPSQDRNPLMERALRVLLQMALEPIHRGSEALQKLNQVGSSLRRYNSPSLKTLYQEALSVHGKDHPGLKDWIDELMNLMSSRDLNTSYQELYRIRKSLEVYAKVLDRDGTIQVPDRLLETLERAQSQIGQLAHPDSKDIAIVNEFYRTLPSVVRLLLKQDYDLSQVGPNAPTKEVARILKSGRLNDLRLLSILSPLSDFILNSSPRPESIEVRTWLRDTSRPRGRELLPLQRFSDLPRAIIGQPGRSVEENLRQGTVYVPTRRRRVEIPAGYGKEEAERITIVLYDTSGSMGGDPGRFQAGLISAFTSKALSDKAPSGKHRHRVVLVPFDTAPGTPVRVTNTAEAIDVIRNYQRKLANTGGGTDIQKALVQAMALIADAEQRAGEPLAAANIIVMTDGQAEINAEELVQKRRAIDRGTPLQTMFIAINQTNEELMRFAMDSQSMGFERGFYREFTEEHIRDILNEAESSNFKGDESSFYTDRGSEDLSPQTYRLLEQAESLATQFVNEVYRGSGYLPAREHLEELEKLRWLDNGQVDRPLEKWISKLRGFIQHPAFSDRRTIERIVDDIVVNVERLTGVSRSNLSDFEQEQLRHLIRYAAGLEGAP